MSLLLCTELPYQRFTLHLIALPLDEVALQHYQLILQPQILIRGSIKLLAKMLYLLHQPLVLSFQSMLAALLADASKIGC